MTNNPAQCPSGDSTAPEAVMFAIAGTEPQAPLLRYLGKVIPISVAHEAGLGEKDVDRSVRVASNCIEGGCRHFDGSVSACALAKTVLNMLPPVVTDAPPCAIRKDCVWWRQEGVPVCRRCPVVTRRQT